MSCKIAHRTLLAVLLNFILLVGSIHAQTITGKVVGVADGDTITVLQDRTQYKIRLYGIDTRRRVRTLVSGHCREFSKFCVTGWVPESALVPAEVKASSENGPSICHVRPPKRGHI